MRKMLRKLLAKWMVSKFMIGKFVLIEPPEEVEIIREVMAEVNHQEVEEARMPAAPFKVDHVVTGTAAALPMKEVVEVEVTEVAVVMMIVDVIPEEIVVIDILEEIAILETAEAPPTAPQVRHRRYCDSCF